jgi:hypothetical protein
MSDHTPAETGTREGWCRWCNTATPGAMPGHEPDPHCPTHGYADEAEPTLPWALRRIADLSERLERQGRKEIEA